VESDAHDVSQRNNGPVIAPKETQLTCKRNVSMTEHRRCTPSIARRSNRVRVEWKPRRASNRETRCRGEESRAENRGRPFATSPRGSASRTRHRAKINCANNGEDDPTQLRTRVGIANWVRIMRCRNYRAHRGNHPRLTHLRGIPPVTINTELAGVFDSGREPAACRFRSRGIPAATSRPRKVPV